jgi:hypothetical protein
MLKAKVYSPKIGACPHAKWITVELDWEKKKNINNYNKLKS